MIRPDLLDVLCCPDTQAKLAIADPSLVDAINEAILAGRVNNRGGRRVTDKLSGGLLREDGVVLYPVVDDIPVMLVDEAIDVAPFKK